MLALPPYAGWILVELAVILAAFAAYWAWNTRRLHRHYLALRKEVQSHLQQVSDAARQIGETSTKLHGEVERLFSDPSDVPGIDRLENVRAAMRGQKEAAERMLAAPMTPALLMGEAVPALSAAIASLEENFSTVLRQWDNHPADKTVRRAAGDAGSPESPTTADRDAMLASLRAEHESLKKMHEELVARHQRARDQIGQMKRDLSQIGDLEEQLAQKEGLREAGTNPAHRGEAIAKNLTPESEGLQGSLVSLRHERDEARTEITRLEAELVSAKNELETAREAVAAQAQPNEHEAALERELAELRREREESEHMLGRLNADLKLARAEAERRANELAASATSARTREAAATPPELNAHQEQIQRIEKANADLQALNEVLLRQNAEAEKAHARRIDELEMDLEEAKAKLDDVKDVRSAAAFDVEKARERAAISAERLEGLEDEMHKRLKRAEEEKTQVTKQYDQLKRDLKQIQQYVDTLEQQNMAIDAGFKRQSHENRKLKVALQSVMTQKAQPENESVESAGGSTPD